MTKTTPLSSQCEHESLMFGSGGFYVICEKCHGHWVAIHHSDNEPDHSRSSNKLSLADKRVKQ